MTVEEGLVWTAAVVDVSTMALESSVLGDRVLPAASVPKVLLLHEAAARIAEGTLDPNALVPRPGPVGGSGLWQHLGAGSLRVADAAALVGACSDNMATNALLEVIGLDAVRAAGVRLGCHRTALNDVIRGERITGVHPDAVSQGTAEELAFLCARLHRGDGGPASAQTISWLSAGMDHSMVLMPFGFDPLSVQDRRSGTWAWNKTGTDAGVRADTGVAAGPRGIYAYAAISGFQGPPHPAMERMHEFGCRLKEAVGA